MTQGSVDVSACDVEPIHVPGAIQPHGLLLALVEPALTVTHVSANLLEVLGVSVERALGRPVAEVIGHDAARALERALEALDLRAADSLPLEIRGRAFEGVLHRNGVAAILELEHTAPALHPGDRALRNAIFGLQRADNIDALCAVAAERVRDLSGFDRVMAYRFHADGHGEVVAEARARDVDSFLGLHFPASDIPRQARQLYRLNPIRVIPDAQFTPVPLLGASSIEGAAPLDLTFAHLRAVSPVHLEYLANMGVRASMSVSLMRGDQLWGLLACHHEQPHALPFSVRSACEVVGRLVSLQIEALEEVARGEQRRALRGGCAAVVETMRSAPEGWATALLAYPESLLRAVNATGAALLDANGVTTTGEVPSMADIAALATWLARRRGGSFATSALSLEFPPAIGYRDIASGLLAVRIPKPQGAHILWFRHERVRTVSWAGDPSKPAAREDGRLHPRHSFSAWKEVVRGTSVPWSAAEVEVGEDVARHAVEADLGEQVAVAELAVRTRDDVVAVVSHDLKNPLNTIRLATQLARARAKDAALVTTLGRIDRAARTMEVLITDLLDLAKIEAGRFQVILAPCDARALVTDALALLKNDADAKRIRLESHDVEDVTIAADLDRMCQVLANLLGNAIKFTPKGGLVSVSTRTAAGFTCVSVSDSGPGIDPHVLPHVFDRYWQAPTAAARAGSGLGLFIAKGLVEAQGGRIRVESVLGAGSTFSFTVPFAHPERG